MPIEGFIDYQRREYCNDIQCPIQVLMNNPENSPSEKEHIRNICKSNCIHSTYEFHHWLIEKGFEVVRKKD